MGGNIGTFEMSLSYLTTGHQVIEPSTCTCTKTLLVLGNGDMLTVHRRSPKVFACKSLHRVYSFITNGKILVFRKRILRNANRQWEVCPDRGLISLKPSRNCMMGIAAPQETCTIPSSRTSWADIWPGRFPMMNRESVPLPALLDSCSYELSAQQCKRLSCDLEQRTRRNAQTLRATRVAKRLTEWSPTPLSGLICLSHCMYPGHYRYVQGLIGERKVTALTSNLIFIVVRGLS